MKDSFVRWRNSIFGRLLFTFLIITVPLYFGGISVYSWGMNIVRHEISNSMVAQVNNYLDELERDISSIKDLAWECCTNDDDLGRLSVVGAYLDDIERTEYINGLQKRLEAIKSSSKYIDNVTAFIPSLARVVYSSGSVASGSVGDIPYDMYDMFKSSRPGSDSGLIQWKGRLFLAVFFPQQTVPKNKNYRLVEVELSVSEIKKALVQIDNYSSRGTLLISPGLDLEIANSIGAGTSEEIRTLLLQKLEKSKSSTFSIEIGDKPYLAIYSYSAYLDMVLCKYIPEDQVFTPLKKYRIVFWIFTGVALVIIVLFTLSTNRFIHQPLLKLVRSFKKLEEGNLDIKIEHRHNDEFRYLYKRFNAMVENLSNLIHQVYREKILAQKAELRHLQSQVNPHFLYNSFFNLHNMVVKGDYDNVQKFTQQLGVYFQFITRDASDKVTLEREAAHARIYADIQARRFRNRISVEFGELPKELENIIVPRLIIQPVIENAFEHGLKNKVAGGLVRIAFFQYPGKLCITIEDNGDEMEESEVDKLNSLLDSELDDLESTGIINIHKRLLMKYSNRSGLRFSKGELQGLKVEITIIIGEGENADEDVQASDS